jgi:hypothetical protein
LEFGFASVGSEAFYRSERAAQLQRERGVFREDVQADLESFAWLDSAAIEMACAEDVGARWIRKPAGAWLVRDGCEDVIVQHCAQRPAQDVGGFALREVD